MELTTVAHFRNAWLRLVGTEADDPELRLNGEAENEVVDTYLTRGCRDAQRFMLENGYGGWQTFSSALTWTEAADGTQTADLPSDFLKARGDRHTSALVRTDGRRWGQQVTQHDLNATGNAYYIDGERIVLLRLAVPPSGLVLDYHAKHDEWDDSVTIDFPMDARYLIVATAANLAKEENWIPLDNEELIRIERALVRAQNEARRVCRSTNGPRQLRRPPRYGNRY